MGSAAPAAAVPVAGLAAPGAGSAMASPRSPAAPAGLHPICTTEQGKGLTVSARLARQAGQVHFWDGSGGYVCCGVLVCVCR